MVVAGDYTGTLNGLAIGTGTPFLIEALTGWRTMRGAALGGAGQLQPKAQGNGSWALPYYMPSREVTLQLAVVATSGESFASAVAALESATQPQGGTLVSLTLQLDGVPSTVTGTVSVRDIPTEFEYQFGLAQATVTLECFDPRRLGTAQTATTNLPTVSGGVTFPVTFPAVWSGTQVSGSVSLTNPGNANGPVTMRIYGPVSAPYVTHLETGASLTLATNLTVNSGDWLDIDCEARTVLYNGQASRNGYVTSRGWFAFEPGVNTISFGSGGYNASAQLSVTCTPAWL